MAAPFRGFRDVA